MIIAVIVGLTIGILFIFIMDMAVEQTPSEKTITGEVVCLPPRPGLEVVLDICRIGFHDVNDRKHYGLILDEENHWLYSAESSSELFTITGTVKPIKLVNSDRYTDLDRYDVVGVIGNVTSIDTLDGDTSIYEVRYRYGDELASILDEAYSDNQYGYSVRTEECDGEPCIAIVLDVYVSGLKEKIPEMINGYKVDIRCCLID